MLLLLVVGSGFTFLFGGSLLLIVFLAPLSAAVFVFNIVLFPVAPVVGFLTTPTLLPTLEPGDFGTRDAVLVEGVATEVLVVGLAGAVVDLAGAVVVLVTPGLVDVPVVGRFAGSVFDTVRANKQ